MSVYAIWNNKGGVGKSYLTFQIASEYALQNPDKKVVVVDLCPQANSSSMLLGGVINGEYNLQSIHTATPRKTISGYIDDRILSPYVNPRRGADYITNVVQYNQSIPGNLYLVVGDEKLELQASQVLGATNTGPQDAWRYVHLWIRDLVGDIAERLGGQVTVFIDCNPSFSIYTTLALAASDHLLIPFSADGSSKRAVRSILSLVYGYTRYQGESQSEYYRNSANFRMTIPSIYMYIGNRLTQMNNSSASAFKLIVNDIAEEIWTIWLQNPQIFQIHPYGAPTPTRKAAFKDMFVYEINDANTASVFSGATGTPISRMTAGPNKDMNGRSVAINQSQLNKQVPNIKDLVRRIA
jgi:chromosome partitioning protein